MPFIDVAGQVLILRIPAHGRGRATVEFAPLVSPMADYEGWSADPEHPMNRVLRTLRLLGVFDAASRGPHVNLCDIRTA